MLADKYKEKLTIAGNVLGIAVALNIGLSLLTTLPTPGHDRINDFYQRRERVIKTDAEPWQDSFYRPESL